MHFIHHTDTCESTNLLAAEYLKKNPQAEGNVFVCNYQTAGKGQRSNTWESAAKQNLTFSFILQPNIDLQNQFKLNIIITFALHKTLRQLVSSNFLKIKWPNDLYYENAKLGGILIENKIQNQVITHSIIGIGINVNQLIFKTPKAISLKRITSKKFELKTLLNQILTQIQATYNRFKTQNISVLKYHYYRYLYGYHEIKRFKTLKSNNPTTFKGIILGITDAGQLIVQKDTHLLYFNLKEIQFLN